MTRRALSRHAYVPDEGVADHRGTRYCAATGCGLPQRHPRHTMPDTDPEVREVTARITGDRDED